MMLSRPKEILKEHIQRVINSYNQLCKLKNIDKIIENLIKNICVEEGIEQYTDIILVALSDILLLHDKGKESPQFQAYIGNEEYRDAKYTNESKRHSILSAYYYLEKYHNEIKKLNLKGFEGRKIEKKLREIICSFSNIINCHHGSLGDYDKSYLLDNIKSHYECYGDAFFGGYDENVIKYYRKSKCDFNGTSLYILTKYMYSILVTCDFMAVHEFKKGEILNINTIDAKVKERFLSSLNENDIVKNIRAFENGKVITGVNKYRSEMFLESEVNLKSADGSLYYLEAPTGCGKSLTSLNLALQMINGEYNKILYVAPFTNIIEQTYNDVKAIIGENNKDVVKIGCKEEIVIENEENKDYDIDNMDNLLINYPFTIISHVRLFDMLFGTKRKQALSMTLLANSVIILDEIQSYKNKIWIPVINELNKYLKQLNIKIIIMSATLPKMNMLLEEETNIVELITNRDYYFSFFKTRVKPDYTLLDKAKSITNREDLIELLYNKVDEVIAEKDNRVLIGTIRRDTCNKIYKYMKKYEEEGYLVCRVTGITSTLKKNNIIRKIKEKNDNGEYKLKKVILVATQCIEAGVDIDMNVGFKNIATLDADEQFCGRIERNFKNQGIVYFFKIDEVEKIYKDDYRANKTLEDLEYRDIMNNKSYNKFYEECFKWLLIKEKDTYEDIKQFKKQLKYSSVNKNLKLIDNNTTTNLLMNCKIKLNDGSIVNLDEIMNLYINIKNNKNIEYGEKQVKLSEFKKQFNMFTYPISNFYLGKVDISREFGMYKVVDNAEDFYDYKEGDFITEESEVDLDRLLEGRLFY